MTGWLFEMTVTYRYIQVLLPVDFRYL